jgi:acetylornithine deacetylase
MERARIEQLLAWLAVDSTSGREAPFLARLERDLAAEGLHTRAWPIEGQDPARRWNLTATVSPNLDDADLWLCTHVDTVAPFLPTRQDGGTIYGRGACDTKGVLLSMLEALAQLRREDPALARRCGLLLVSGEETDHCGAAAVASMGLRAKVFILGEPTQCGFAVGQRGVLKFSLRALGVAAHSAYPELGASAIHKLLDVLQDLRAASWPSERLLGQTTFHVARVQGGVADNVFAPEASATLMFRVVSPSHEVEAQARALVADRAELTVLSRAEPQWFDRPAGNFRRCIIAFNSDAAWLKPLAPVWLGGPGDIRVAHADHEHITLDDLDYGVQFYRDLLWAAHQGR